MNKLQTQKVNMIDTSVAVLNIPTNKTLWTANTAFNSAVTSIATNMAILNSSDSTRMSSSAPFTETKGQAKVTLIAATLLHAAAGIGYAASVNNIALKTTCSISETSLVAAKDADLGNLCMNIYNAIQPFVGSMASWNVTAATMGVLNTDITAFASMVGTPQAQMSTQYSAATAIDTQIEIIDGILTNTIDTLMMQFKASHAAFYNAYESARKVHSTGVHHSTTVAGYIYKTGGIALPNMEVIVSLAGNQLRKHFTDASGHYRFTRLHLGTYDVTVSGAGYDTQTKTNNVTVLQSIEDDFTMVATGVPNSGNNTNTQ